MSRQITFLELEDASSPFRDWLLQLRDPRSRAKIQARIARLSRGNFGDFKSLGEGVFELRVHFGPGFRVYFGFIETQGILIINGGSKKTQKKDIKKAKELWERFKDESKRLS